METPAQQLARFKRADERVRLAQQTALSDDQPSFLMVPGQLYAVITAAAEIATRINRSRELSNAETEAIVERLMAGDIIQNARLY